MRIISPSANGSGSSPLARGTLRLLLAVKNPKALIPAHAGNTLKSTLCMALTRAHPRSRGEHFAVPWVPPPVAGSSPLARGTRRRSRRFRSPTGLIPARAGNTIVCNTIHFERRAHPRSRGEHPGAVTESPGDQGSSPLARGTLLRYMNIIAQAGLIPSPEGNTVTAPRRMTYSRAHPRSRGEHLAL